MPINAIGCPSASQRVAYLTRARILCFFFVCLPRSCPSYDGWSGSVFFLLKSEERTANRKPIVTPRLEAPIKSERVQGQARERLQFDLLNCNNYPLHMRCSLAHPYRHEGVAIGR